MLMGYTPYGTDLSERMVDYSKKNLTWLEKQPFARQISSLSSVVEAGDATTYQWHGPIGAVACETYLGPPMSQPPAEIKLKSAQQECREIVLGFLKNISPQLASGTPVVCAIPAWLRPNNTYSRLNLLDELPALGYNVKKHQSLGLDSLLYYREGQIVAREIIVLRKK
jgi:tRNA G10  N-methylase Trm11